MSWAKQERRSRRLPRSADASVDLAAVDRALDALKPRARRRRAAAVDTSDAALGGLVASVATLRAELPPAQGPERYVEPGPLTVTQVDALASLPPPPTSLPPSSALRAEPGALPAAEGLREPSLAPPPDDEAASRPTVVPPGLSLAPPPPAERVTPPPPPLPAAPLSVGPEALELDLSVLGPSEVPPASPFAEDVVPVVELDEVELDEVRISSEPSTRRVAPPLPPPAQRRLRGSAGR